MNSESPEPTLTVVLMNYNQAVYIQEAYDAILSQSYQPIEIILTDDAMNWTFDNEMVGQNWTRNWPK